MAIRVNRQSTSGRVKDLAKTGGFSRAVDGVLQAGGQEQAGGLNSDQSRLAAHEIRSHVAVLRGYLSMIEDGSLGEPPPAMARVVPELQAKARAIGQLVEDMLEDARLEDGELHLSRRTVDLNEVMLTAVADARRSSLPGTHRLVNRLPPRPAFVSADPARIATILRNLLDNAIKYSPEGGTIECVLEVEGDHAIIRVTDEGIGVDPAQVDRLFKRFGRARPLRGATIEGVGLGLYICRTLAELHGGSLTYSPRASGGSVFSLRLPLSDSRRAD